jgi:hypothetical protein
MRATATSECAPWHAGSPNAVRRRLPA